MDDNAERTGEAAVASGDAGEAIETAGGVGAAGRRLITEDWAATITGLVLIALVIFGVIAKGMVP